MRNLFLTVIMIVASLAALAACGAPAATPTVVSAAPTAIPSATAAKATTAAPSATPVPTATTATTAPTATAAMPAETATLPPLPAEAIFQLVKPDRTVVNFTLDDLTKLPLVSIMAGGKPQEGPALLAVLEAAGVTDFKQVTVSGNGSVTLTKDQITSEVVLDFANNRPSVKIASPNLPIPSPATDITLITVE